MITIDIDTSSGRALDRRIEHRASDHVGDRPGSRELKMIAAASAEQHVRRRGRCRNAVFRRYVEHGRFYSGNLKAETSGTITLCRSWSDAAIC